MLNGSGRRPQETPNGESNRTELRLPTILQPPNQHERARCESLPKRHDDSGIERQIILVVVDMIVERGQKVICLNEA